MVRILTIGDSHTAGYPRYDPIRKDNLELTYQYWLKKFLIENKIFTKVDIFNFGIPGDSSKGILERLSKVFNDNKYKDSEIFIINGGGNDWGTNPIDYSDTVQNLLDCCNICLENDRIVIMSSISPFGDLKIVKQIQELAEILKKFILNNGSENLKFFNWFEYVFDQNTNCLYQKYDSGDNEHLNIQGYKQIGTELAKIITRMELREI
ncbi:MAG: SGNH/GDSL hydrolase family protein [Candidatus Thorarchaeota archaeon]